MLMALRFKPSRFLKGNVRTERKQAECVKHTEEWKLIRRKMNTKEEDIKSESGIGPGTGQNNMTRDMAGGRDL